MTAPCIVVGAGPAGLFLACRLARLGIRCSVIDERREPSRESKALAIMPKTLRLFERSGLLERFLRDGVRLERLVVRSRFGHVEIPLQEIGGAYPFVLLLPQYRTEALLSDAAKDAGASIERGARFESFEQNDSHVSVRLHDGETTVERDCAYLVGCDGVRSAVREAARIAFDGTSYERATVLADLPLKTSLAENEAHVVFQRDEMLTLFPTGARTRRMVVSMPHLPDVTDRDWFAERARLAFDAELVDEPLWVSRFFVHSRAARRLVSGRVAIAGDAAHAHSPLGGQGMNVGLADACTLADALQQALSGDDAALARYEVARLRVARRVVRETTLLTQLVAAHRLALAREALAPALFRVEPLRRIALQRLAHANA